MLAGPAGSAEQARLVRIYLWYPAVTSPDAAPMRFGRYASFAEDDAWPYETPLPFREKLSFSRKALARSLGPEGFEALGEHSLRALENAEPLSGPFPLVVLGQGLYYESPIAFLALSEYLAGRGFVVATCPLVGRHAPIAKVDIAVGGLFGLISMSVAQRTSEIGVRMALGANARHVSSLIVGDGMKLAATGAVVGVAATIGIARYVSSFLYGVSPTDFRTLVSIVSLMLVAASIASYVPARRVARTNPTVALRHE